jgi:hypothetical protein
VNSSDADEIEELSSRASGQLVDASTILAHLRAANRDPGTLDEISDVTAQIGEHLTLMRSVALDGIATTASSYGSRTRIDVMRRTRWVCEGPLQAHRVDASDPSGKDSGISLARDRRCEGLAAVTFSLPSAP